jgi:hypothetical protein
MTPEERQLVTGLFDRLTKLEGQPRDPDAEAAIRAGLARSPNALYPLVQTVLLQEEALAAAQARIRALEGTGEEPPGGFLDSMRNAVFGRPEPRGAVPSVPRDDAPMGVPPGWRSRMAAAPAEAPAQRSSFLGTAAATAAGVVMGALAFDAVRSLVRPANAAQPVAADTPQQAGLDQSGTGPHGDDTREAAYEPVDDVDQDWGGGDIDIGDIA